MKLEQIRRLGLRRGQVIQMDEVGRAQLFYFSRVHKNSFGNTQVEYGYNFEEFKAGIVNNCPLSAIKGLVPYVAGRRLTNLEGFESEPGQVIELNLKRGIQFPVFFCGILPGDSLTYVHFKESVGRGDLEIPVTIGEINWARPLTQRV